MKNHITFALSLLSMLAAGQTPSLNSTIERHARELKTRRLDSSLCSRYYHIAVRDIQRNNLSYPTNHYEDTVYYYFNKTEWLWLKENTPFISHRIWYEEDSLEFSDDIPFEAQCYNFVASEYKKQMYGEDFSYTVIQKTDSLKKIGQGFTPAHIKRKDIESFVRRRSRLKVDFENFNEIYNESTNSIRAELHIDEKGEICSITCWKTHRMQGPFRQPVEANDPYVVEIQRILKRIGKIDPARYKNRSIKDVIGIYFPFTSKENL